MQKKRTRMLVLTFFVSAVVGATLMISVGHRNYPATVSIGDDQTMGEPAGSTQDEFGIDAFNANWLFDRANIFITNSKGDVIRMQMPSRAVAVRDGDPTFTQGQWVSVPRSFVTEGNYVVRIYFKNGDISRFTVHGLFAYGGRSPATMYLHVCGAAKGKRVGLRPAITLGASALAGHYFPDSHREKNQSFSTRLHGMKIRF